jgi:hypothetical protein
MTVVQWQSALCRVQMVWYQRDYAVGRESTAGSSWYRQLAGRSLLWADGGVQVVCGRRIWDRI